MPRGPARPGPMSHVPRNVWKENTDVTPSPRRCLSHTNEAETKAILTLTVVVNEAEMLLYALSEVTWLWCCGLGGGAAGRRVLADGCSMLLNHCG